jgi:hypothetical protein
MEIDAAVGVEAGIFCYWVVGGGSVWRLAFGVWRLAFGVWRLEHDSVTPDSFSLRNRNRTRTRPRTRFFLNDVDRGVHRSPAQSGKSAGLLDSEQGQAGRLTYCGVDTFPPLSPCVAIGGMLASDYDSVYENERRRKRFRADR